MVGEYEGIWWLVCFVIFSDEETQVTRMAQKEWFVTWLLLAQKSILNEIILFVWQNIRPTSEVLIQVNVKAIVRTL